MEDKYRKYSKKEIQNLCKNIDKMIIIGIDTTKFKEEFKQLCLNDKYLPYIVSSYGRIFSINYKHKKNSCRRLKTSFDKDGYELLIFVYNNESFGYHIHRLVALTFIDNPDPIHKTQVNHKNGSKICNCSFNLEWTTPKENINHAWKTGLTSLYGENNNNNKFSKESIIEVCKLLEKNKSFKEISKITHVSYAMISLIYRKRFWVDISKEYNFDNYTYGRK